MKNSITFIYTAALLFGLAGCKKENIGAAESRTDYVSYKYNSKQYSSGVSFFNNRISITVPGEPDRLIYFSFPTCAFAVPAGISFGINSINNICEPTFGGQVIDSSQIYLYRSGKLSYSYSDCYDSHTFSFGPEGGTIKTTYCTVTGNFECTLGNNKNELITITEGKFVFTNVER